MSEEPAAEAAAREFWGTEEEHIVAPARRLVNPPAPSERQAAPCPICGGAGYIVLDLPIGHPDFGKASPCRCRSQQRSEKRVQSLQHLGSSEALRRFTFENFIPEPGHLSPEKTLNLRTVFDMVVHYAQEPDGWLLLSGSYGCGKTHLAAAICNARFDIGEPAVFLVVPDLLDHLRAAFSPNAGTSYDDLFDQIRNIELLILDDLGTQSSTPWAQEKLFQLLNHRYTRRLPTVITTNQRLDDLEPRLRSRLQDVELVEHCPITVPDFRTGKHSSQAELSTLGLHQDQRLDNFELQRGDLDASERANLRSVFEICRQYAEEPQGWLVLAGESGSGKTHLAAAVANEYVLRSRADVMFITVPDLLDHLRAAFNPQAATPYDRRFDEVKRSNMLVLDDLGTESATPWAKEKLFQLLNFRYQALLPTVITTSVETKQLEPWLRTRILDVNRCRYVGLIVPPYRSARPDAGPSRPRGRPATGRR